LQLQPRRGGLSDPSLLPVEVLYLRAMNMAQSSPEAAIAILESLVKLYGRAGADVASNERGSIAAMDTATAGDDAARSARCVQLAQQQLASLRDDVAKQTTRQLASVQERLAAADELKARDPRAARDMYHAIIDLYGKDAWAAEAVRQARQGIAELKPGGDARENE
jgi:hypothetical protein